MKKEEKTALIALPIILLVGFILSLSGSQRGILFGQLELLALFSYRKLITRWALRKEAA